MRDIRTSDKYVTNLRQTKLFGFTYTHHTKLYREAIEPCVLVPVLLSSKPVSWV